MKAMRDGAAVSGGAFVPRLLPKWRESFHLVKQERDLDDLLHLRVKICQAARRLRLTAKLSAWS